MSQIGIMQGRLSRPRPGRLQAFPWPSWESEFERAAECGFDSIEWLFESDRHEENPIWSAAGVEQIRARVAATGTAVRSLCADYFMAHPFFRVSSAERSRSVEVLQTLVVHAAEAGIRTLLVPVLEEAELRSEAEKAFLIDALRGPLALARSRGVRIGLETELPAREYRGLVERAADPALGIYYDTGNATAKGFDIGADIGILGPFLCGVHIKDRAPAGTSVWLGHGGADFVNFFDALAKTGYAEGVVLQAPSGEAFLEAARTQREFVERHLRREPIPSR
jgi:L-ribulose-5-phosphate 3-epimerase